MDTSQMLSIFAHVFLIGYMIILNTWHAMKRGTLYAPMTQWHF